tara:strand:- start:559 stop:828 length:270 start_codon:yes stop_codon:yes gene_type:complete
MIDGSTEVIQQTVGVVVIGIQRQPGNTLTQTGETLGPNAGKRGFPVPRWRFDNGDATLGQSLGKLLKTWTRKNASATTRWGDFGRQQHR